MDANQEITGKQVQKLISSTGLIDLVATKLGANTPETQIRGSKTIDLILGKSSRKSWNISLS
jgi:hypothetical protein